MARVRFFSSGAGARLRAAMTVFKVSLGLRAQIFALGLAGVAVLAAISLVGMQLESRSRATADAFERLAFLTNKLSESSIISSVEETSGARIGNTPYTMER